MKELQELKDLTIHDVQPIVTANDRNAALGRVSGFGSRVSGCGHRAQSFGFGRAGVDLGGRFFFFTLVTGPRRSLSLE